jgi:hypothetical protein
MLAKALAATVALSLFTLNPSPSTAMGEGFFFSFGLGGGVVSGDRDVALKVPKKCQGGGLTGDNFLWSEQYKCVGSPTQASHEESVRTDFGSGFGFQFRLGYNIKGLVSVEGFLMGHGDPGPGAASGMGHAGLQLRYHPVAHGIEPEGRLWDVDVMLGVGYTVGGFSPDPDVQGDDDEKAWDGIVVTTGVAFNYEVSDRVALGLDLKFLFPRFSSFIANWDKDYVEEPEETPFTMVFLPTAELKFLF